MNACEFITKWHDNWVSFQHVTVFPHVQGGDGLQIWGGKGQLLIQVG